VEPFAGDALEGGGTILKPSSQDTNFDPILLRCRYANSNACFSRGNETCHEG
jgi:hypothetical protein